MRGHVSTGWRDLSADVVLADVVFAKFNATVSALFKVAAKPLDATLSTL